LELTVARLLKQHIPLTFLEPGIRSA